MFKGSRNSEDSHVDEKKDKSDPECTELSDHEAVKEERCHISS